MIYNFRENQIFYKFTDKRKNVTNIYLHGWGCDHTSLLFCQDYITEANSLFVDFPPFGKSEKNIKDFSVFTYANMVISLCEFLGIKNYNIIGHSFGGRIAIIMAVLTKTQTQKLVLVDSAGLKPRRSLKYYFKVFSYKFKKRFGLKIKNAGSSDYQKLSADMKQIFVGIVNTHLDDFLPFIHAKTLIVFGKNDKDTPVYMAKKMHKKIKNSSLIILENAGHFSFVDQRVKFLTELKTFLN